MLHLDLGRLDAVRARRRRRLPVVRARDEVCPLLDALDQLPTPEPCGLMARLRYGAGLRLMECCRLRVKEVDRERNQRTVRQGKGDHDLRTVQELLGHADVSTTMIYTQVLGNGVAGVRSPLDGATAPGSPRPAR